MSIEDSFLALPPVQQHSSSLQTSGAPSPSSRTATRDENVTTPIKNETRTNFARMNKSNKVVLSVSAASQSVRTIDERNVSRSPLSLSLTFNDRIERYFEGLSNRTATQWFHTYLQWHHQMRTAYQDTELFDNESGPKLVIAHFDPDAHKNGLADRMRGLGHMLEFAYKEKRVLLLKWYDAPLPLESFLVPHLMNFTVPDHPSTRTPQLLNSTYVAGSVLESQPDRIIYIPFEISKVFADHYGVYWHALFRPSDPVQKRIDDAMRTMNLVPGQFDATHLRVTHPAFRRQNNADYKAVGIALDEGNQYKFEGKDRTMALGGAVRAIKCTEWIAQQHGFLTDIVNTTNRTAKQKIFFYGDSPDLVKTVLNPNSIRRLPEQNRQESKHLQELRKLASNIEIVGRHDVQVAHLQNRQETSIDAFLSTFVDLYIASYARCLGLGVGRFAFIAGKISGTTCWTRHLAKNHGMVGYWGNWVVRQDVDSCGVPI